MITHRESTLSLADKVVRIEYGKLEPVIREVKAA
jgi:ABC-type transport system involved in cytochrome bd biosynthesis fused ATPase/permease subunit